MIISHSIWKEMEYEFSQCAGKPQIVLQGAGGETCRLGAWLNNGAIRRINIVHQFIVSEMFVNIWSQYFIRFSIEHIV